MKQCMMTFIVAFVLSHFAASCVSPVADRKLDTIVKIVESATIHDLFWNEYHGLGAQNSRGGVYLSGLIHGLRGDRLVLNFKYYYIEADQTVYVENNDCKTAYCLKRDKLGWVYHKNTRMKNGTSFDRTGDFTVSINPEAFKKYLTDDALSPSQLVYLRKFFEIIDSEKYTVLGDDRLRGKGNYIVGPASPFSLDRYVFDTTNGLLYLVPMYYDQESFAFEAVNILARCINYNKFESYAALEATSTDEIDLLALHGDQIATLHIISKVLLFGHHLGPLDRWP